MNIRFLHTSFLSLFLLATLTPVALAQTNSTAQWSTKVWSAASGGNWDTVGELFSKIPGGDDAVIIDFKEQLATYKHNRTSESEATNKSREEALEKMNVQFENGNILQAMQSAVNAQTLSNSLDDIMYNDDVQKVLAKAQQEINSSDKKKNVLTTQTLLYYLRTFYEGTSRRDLYDLWNDQLENVALHVSLLRQYAPKHLHALFAERAEILGDEPPEEYNDEVADNWVERVSDIDKSMVIRSLETAVNEHISGISWETLIEGGLQAIRKLGNIPVIDETFQNASESKKQRNWLLSVDEELESYKEYLQHISGKRCLKQILERLFSSNTMQLPEGMILREFGDGAMSKLDKYSSIIWPNEWRNFQQQTEGRFVGVGIVIRENPNGEIIVVNPIEGTPAYYGGVQPNDVIVSVNGTSASGWSLNDAVDRITGPKGTFVNMTLRRPNSEEPVEVMLTRDNIKLHSVQGWWKKDLDEDGQPNWDWYIDRENKIGYIKLTTFSDESYTDMLSAIRALETDGIPSGLILDLRYNPGGLLPIARQISNLFVSSGTIVSGEAASGEELFRMRARSNRAFLSGWPVVILINQGSASASEIVAGCVQAHDAGIIVGQRSWGKGSVQTVHSITSESNVKLTTQYYRLPSHDGGKTKGRLVHKRRGSTDWGVIPDVEVKMSPDQITKSNELRQKADIILIDTESDKRPDVQTLITEGIDPQLETALLLLRANALSRTVADYRRAKLD